jgi:hypothetical protein
MRSCFESLAVASHPVQPYSILLGSWLINNRGLFSGRSQWAARLCAL